MHRLYSKKLGFVFYPRPVGPENLNFSRAVDFSVGEDHLKFSNGQFPAKQSWTFSLLGGKRGGSE